MAHADDGKYHRPAFEEKWTIRYGAGDWFAVYPDMPEAYTHRSTQTGWIAWKDAIDLIRPTKF